MRLPTKFLASFSSATLLWAATVLLSPASIAQAADATGNEFFEQKIRPILVDNCYDCHSQNGKKGVKGSLQVDTKEGLLKGGDTGPAITPGNLDKSLLIKAVRYTSDDLQMPPKNKKLSAQQIADLEAWVKMGAPDPRSTGVAALSPFERIMADGKKHWAFQPVHEPPVPAVKNTRWVKSPIDAFILAKQEAKELQPAPPADKRTLIRRATFDLIGLPPTEAELNAFLADKSPDAFAKVVDRLLASPQYGERWGRHWLDVARYADTKGYLAGNEQRRYPYSYTYRDYVIRAFNNDLPYDRFIIEQIAADKLELGQDKSALAGLGFLTLGRRFLNNVPDIIDDRIDVIGRGLEGLTVGCARCHDHKFDPIPTKDYYSLYSVFDSSREPDEKPLLGLQPPEKEYKEYLAERARKEEEYEKFRTDSLQKELEKLHTRAGDYLLVATEAKKEEGKAIDRMAQQKKLEPFVVRRWMSSLDQWAKAKDPIFSAWRTLSAIPEAEFAAKAPALCKQLTADGSVNPLVAKALAENPPTSLQEVADRYGKLLNDIDTAWKEAQKTGAKQLSDAHQEALRQVFYATKSPIDLNDKEQDELLGDARPRLRELRANVDLVDATHPGAPPRAMALVDGNPHNVRVFVRGNPGNPGPEAPRQFLEILAGAKREPFKQGSGRLELAQAIASKDNPLTARVYVNRVWLEHFGFGLVRTPSDFGVRADPPTHPELLDFLAARFMQDGWSVKKLHRLMMLSSTYQQSSDEDPRYTKQFTLIDPANFLLWKMNRRRLDFESMRDTMLQVSGRLDLTPGGLPVDLTSAPVIPRRTVYGFVDRQNLPSMFRTFDFANPDTSSPRRFNTTVPQQALFMMNNPFVVDLSRSMMARKEIAGAADDAERIQRLYAIVYQRKASPDEIQLAKAYLTKMAEAKPHEEEKPTWVNGYGTYSETDKRITKFAPLPKFMGGTWQGGDKFPDAKLGYASLNATGGHPGSTANESVIRRWTAPMDGVVALDGKLVHSSPQGDGVRGRAVSSRSGKVGEWIAFNKKTGTKVARVEVKKGDTIDFVTDCRTENSFDSFTWAPRLTYLEVSGPATAGGRREWDAQQDFTTPTGEAPKPLTPWEKYVQALLLSNELVFVD